MALNLGIVADGTVCGDCQVGDDLRSWVSHDRNTLGCVRALASNGVAGLDTATAATEVVAGIGIGINITNGSVCVAISAVVDDGVVDLCGDSGSKCQNQGCVLHFEVW